jgi:hypothetical protein
VRTDAVDLDIFGNRIRVICENETEANRLKTDLRNHVINDPVPVGFIMKPPQRDSKLHVLLDRSGFVLGRSRTAGESLTILKEHLGVFVSPPPTTVRLRMRAFLGSDGSVVVVDSPLPQNPPVAERRIQREGYQIIDRLVIDINPDRGLDITPAFWPVSDRSAIVGHAETMQAATPISGVLLTSANAIAPTKACRVAHFAARISSASSIEARLDAAEWLASLPTAYVAPDDPSAIYIALNDLRASQPTLN